MPEIILSYTNDGDINHHYKNEGELVRCIDCIKHNKSLYDVDYKDEACPLVAYRGKAQGHEFDHQYCIYGRADDGKHEIKRH